jgi:hypothetical protein
MLEYALKQERWVTRLLRTGVGNSADVPSSFQGQNLEQRTDDRFRHHLRWVTRTAAYDYRRSEDPFKRRRKVSRGTGSTARRYKTG